jgi:HAE1 family hydrophobic/amphiphilic exporter-1
MTDLRAALVEQTPASLSFGRPSLVAMDTPLEVIVTGDDLDRLQATGLALVPRLSAIPGLTDVRTSLLPGNPEIRIRYDRLRLARYGLDTRTVAERVRDRVQGREATELSRGEQRVPVRVQLREGERSSREDLAEINVNPDVRPPIPLRAVADLEDGVGPSEIRRVDQQRAVVLSANLAGFDLAGTSARIRSSMADFSLGDDMRWSLGGQADELGGAVAAMGLALGLAVFLVYVIMASTFEHLLHPLLILFTVPLAGVGVVGGLWVTGTPVSVVAGLGMIVLAGVVVNNAIVLVDAINRLRAEGESAQGAIARAAALRLRPILITTTTTVLGLAPLLFGIGAGAEIQRPLAVTVVLGLSASTLLTLAVIPAAYAALSREAAS